MRCLETALGLALLALGATAAWSSSCKPCTCGLSITGLRTAEWWDKALTSIPPFPVDTEKIEIWGRNNISSLHGGEFNGYTNLTNIEITNNPLTELPSGIFSKTVNVININLRYNKLKILQSHLFSNLLYLQQVWLYGNQISVLEENCFSNFPRLRIIDLHSNHLSKINQSFINDYSSLKQLHFYDNPVYCEDGICELMNRVVQRKLYKNRRMPRCAEPPSVQNKTWEEAVEALWGAGPERCPAERRGPGSAGPPEPTRGAEAELKDAGLQLLVAELNKSSTVLEALYTENLGLKAEQENLKGIVEVLVREIQAKRNAQEAAYGFFKTEISKTRSEVSREQRLVQQGLRQAQNATNALLKEELNKSSRVLEELHTENLGFKAEQEKLKGVVDVLVRETQANRNAQGAAYGFFKTEMNKTKRELSSELHLVQQGLRQVQHAQNATNALFKENVNKTRSELQLVKKDLHSELLALKEDVRTLLEQTKQGKDVANILFKKVYHSEGTGLLVLRYSVLPSPDNTSLPAP